LNSFNEDLKRIERRVHVTSKAVEVLVQGKCTFDFFGRFLHHNENKSWTRVKNDQKKKCLFFNMILKREKYYT